jgi:hypothetical protein
VEGGAVGAAFLIFDIESSIGMSELPSRQSLAHREGLEMILRF